MLLADRESTIADTQAVLDNPRLYTILEEGCYLPPQAFNVDKTGLFWKWLPERVSALGPSCYWVAMLLVISS